MGVYGKLVVTNGGNSVTTVTPDCQTGAVAGDLQYLWVSCQSLNAGTDWTTKPTASGWTEVADRVQNLGGGIWNRAGMYSRTFAASNPTITGPQDQTGNGYRCRCVTIKSSSTRVSPLQVDVSTVIDASAGTVAVPSITISRAQGTYFWFTQQAQDFSNQVSLPWIPFVGFGSSTDLCAQWFGQGLPGGMFPAPGQNELNTTWGFALGVTDGGVNNGPTMGRADTSDPIEKLGSYSFPFPTIRMKDSQLIENVIVVAGSSGVSGQFGSGGGISITP